MPPATTTGTKRSRTTSRIAESARYSYSSDEDVDREDVDALVDRDEAEPRPSSAATTTTTTKTTTTTRVKRRPAKKSISKVDAPRAASKRTSSLQSAGVNVVQTRLLGDELIEEFEDCDQTTSTTSSSFRTAEVATNSSAYNHIPHVNDSQLWSDKYTPKRVDDLAVHKKKIEEVRAVLLDVLCKGEKGCAGQVE